MTNYNERLDEILDNYIATFKDTLNGRDEDTHSKAKAALTSLIKELVAEAKPRHLSDTSGYHEDFTPEQLTRITAANRASNEAVKEFEQNLLKALEEV